MFVKIHSCAVIGLDGEAVEVETDLMSCQLPTFTIVGLPDAAVQESRERVRLAILNSGFPFPRKKVTVNLAPADLRKEGAVFDLPIALSILKSSEVVDFKIDDSLLVGELALNGELRPITGVLSIALFAKKKGFKSLFLPKANAAEAALVEGIAVYPVDSLAQLIDHLQGDQTIVAAQKSTNERSQNSSDNDFKYIIGQEQAKRALEIAAAGFHNILMSGPPGSGKTMLARTLPSLLPPMSFDETIEVTRIYSAAGMLAPDQAIINERPFRAPHHTSSGVALVGGGRIPRPGEISLAHRGILFLDEFPEFPRTVLENLRQPLEDGIVAISRAQGTLTFPANFTLVASQNPCPCGYATDPEQQCTCSPSTIIKYQKKISGPLLDRIDMHIEVPRLNIDKLQHAPDNIEDSQSVRQRVINAQQIQQERFAGSKILYNAEMGAAEIKRFCKMDEDSINLMKRAGQKLRLSARSYHRILKLARTIADLEQHAEIQSTHIAEALSYRQQ